MVTTRTVTTTMAVRGCWRRTFGVIAVTILVLFAFLVITHNKDWCNSALNAGHCEYNEEDEYCYCIDTFKHKNLTDQNDIYDSSRAQCETFNGNLAAPDENELSKWLGKRMFFMGIENAVVALRKLSSKWYWIKGEGKNEEAVDIKWRPEFPPNSEHQQGILTVETVKENMGNDEYNYYNYDHYVDTDISYEWHGFSTINENFTDDAYYICKYDSDPCYCSADAKIVLDDLDDSHAVQSPQYPANYCSDLNCKWLVSVPQGLVVEIDWLVFSLETGMDFVYIRDGHHPNSPLIKECTGVTCGNQRSSDNLIQIHFHTDHVTTDIGFRTRVTAVDPDPCYCSESLKIELGNLFESFGVQSPSYPSTYCANHNCQWTFVAPLTYGLHISFKIFDIEDNHDYLEIYDGGLITDRMFDKCTGANCPERISSGNEMHFRFKTNAIVTANEGFQGIVTVVQNYCLQTEIAENRNITLEEPYIKEIVYSMIRDDGFIPVGANATMICANNSKMQGTVDTIIDLVICESPKWNRNIAICVPTCKVEFYVIKDVETEFMNVCKSGDTDDMPLRMIESGESVTMLQYEFFSQQLISEVVYTCKGNDWTDQMNNYYNIINCHEDPKILIIGGELDSTRTMELYYPRNPNLNRMLSKRTIKPRTHSSSGIISDGSILTCGGVDEELSCERYFPKQNTVRASEPLNNERWAAPSSVLNGVMYICGGEDELRTLLVGTCERYIIDVGWEFISPMNMTCNQWYLCTMAAYKGQLIVIGGDAAQAYSQLTDSWSKFPRPNHQLNIQAQSKAAVLNGKLFFCGGIAEEKSCEQYDQVNNGWVFVADMKKWRLSFSMVTMGSMMIGLGGDEGQWQNTVEMFDGKEWILLEKRLQKPRAKHTAVLIP